MWWAWRLLPPRAQSQSPDRAALNLTASAQLFGAVRGFRAALQVGLWHTSERQLVRWEKLARDQMADNAWLDHYERGQQLSGEQALALATQIGLSTDIVAWPCRTSRPVPGPGIFTAVMPFAATVIAAWRDRCFPCVRARNRRADPSAARRPLTFTSFCCP
jgi:hypothetical protein